MRISDLVLASALLTPNFVSAQLPGEHEQCLHGLEFVVTRMRENHPNLYHRINEKGFESTITAARLEISVADSVMECYLAIKKVVASIQDGHTQLFDRDNLGVEQLRYPFRLEAFSDGVFVTVIRKDYEQYLASRVLEIDGMSIDDVPALTTEITSMDNEYGRIRPFVQDITFAKTIYGLGITKVENELELTVRTPARVRRKGGY